VVNDFATKEHRDHKEEAERGNALTQRRRGAKTQDGSRII